MYNYANKILTKVTLAQQRPTTNESTTMYPSRKKDKKVTFGGGFG